MSVESPKPLDAAHDACELRCMCGRLVARLVPGGVEIRCARCKRVIVVPLSR